SDRVWNHAPGRDPRPIRSGPAAAWRMRRQPACCARPGDGWEVCGWCSETESRRGGLRTLTARQRPRTGPSLRTLPAARHRARSRIAARASTTAGLVARGEDRVSLGRHTHVLPLRLRSLTLVIVSAGCRVPRGRELSAAMPPAAITAELLSSARAGSREAFDRLFAQVYDELRGIAHQRRLRHHPGDALNTTGLVHEAYPRLPGQAPL